MTEQTATDSASTEVELDPALSGLGELAEKPVQPTHPLSTLPQVANGPRINRRRHSRREDHAKANKREAREGPQVVTGAKGVMPFRKRWPRGLDVRHSKRGIDDLQSKFYPLLQNRLKEYGRFQCEPLSHVDLARAFVDFCRERVRLPRDASPRTYLDLRRVVDEAMNAWVASELTSPRDTAAE